MITLPQLINIKQDVTRTFAASNIFRYNVKDITHTLFQLDLDQLTIINTANTYMFCVFVK